MSESITIRQNAIAIELARTLYEAHSRYYELLVPNFDHLPNSTKQQWVDLAAEDIVAIGPPRLSMFRELEEGRTGRVIGRIDASVPWGEPA
ncbi:MAG TPA: hypothetical protein VF491_17725 [Vicinamibacterales bacterium]